MNLIILFLLLMNMGISPVEVGMYKNINLTEGMIGNWGVHVPSEKVICFQYENITQATITLDHEICHALVHENPEHFCGWYNEDS